MIRVYTGGKADADVDTEAAADVDAGASLDTPSVGGGAAAGVDLGGLAGLGADAEYVFFSKYLDSDIEYI